MAAGKQPATLEELSKRIIYSDRCTFINGFLYQKSLASGNAPSIIDSDDRFEYRHVILPKQMLKLIPKRYFASDDSGLLRILEEDEWRGIGITQSLGWEHFEVHAPEPHIRR
ncbi:cyclin-dependent kinase regulatory subunit [Cryptococcus deuterogattii 99/473]|uniref:Cyclin-dependent kinases regulatory subunit n=1 Tax=Cryptococcus deuterogattii Ram5 TaxID=1296110 RepID=A0A0D0TX18_9TREE|nr:cyclin-dependent kinase regulatory subunit [Cryptococcus deuterogattii LA55]KIR35162.1 cyclin-dependent kinase regulatory subunit [Cryptococcus deuterogattii MMRL2647]KIR40428.1 cyclin-dependent kinase regulatory subunit [Cryptococcus deuterogattii Ram5]KIR72140.1 cyclin-dependent kinase regulatory subunit [Cryptococcus deuterogattii CA1014]KIR93701.1 cyclin-dependent kinase regulatory subunit [Cryptococcus deuterogattii CBS 10090]KIR99969.1 cyclin-dependent kinase regulatory subunit [Crypt